LSGLGARGAAASDIEREDNSFGGALGTVDFWKELQAMLYHCVL
jgi:hypothetical protein